MNRLLALLLILAATVSSASAQSLLKVRTTDNRRINVMLDGRYFNKAGTSVTVGDLPYGRHRLKIYSESYNRRGRPVQDVIYEGKLRTEPGMITIVEFDPNSGEVHLTEQDIDAYSKDHPIPPQENNGNMAGNGADQESNDASASPAGQETAGTLTQSKMDDLKAKVAALKTDTEKMNALRDALGGETFTTAQVGEVMNWFSFESTKVDFAKWAYNSAVDKEYYSDLLGKFTYKNYQDDLDNFLKTK